MRIHSLLKDLETALETKSNSPRRNALKNFWSIGKSISLAAAPVVMSGIFQKTQAQTTPANPVAESLNFLLAFEYLQFTLYDNALKQTILPATSVYIPVITSLRDQELAHINLLGKTIQDIGGTPRTPIPYDAFDHTRSNAITNLNTNLGNFMRMAMSVEDLCERAYKGQLQTLLQNKIALTVAAQIHTAEARHSAQIREIVRELANTGTGITNLKQIRPWVSNRQNDDGTYFGTASDNWNESTIGGLAGIYDRDDATLANRENKTVQAGVNIADLTVSRTGNTRVIIGPHYAASAFDEYLLTNAAKTQINTYLKTGFKLP